MKKKFWIAVLTAVLLLNILPVMTPSAAAAYGQSYGTLRQTCPECKTEQKLEIIGRIWKRDGYQVNETQHWLQVLCPSCKKVGYIGGEDHTGGTETPTCTTGKTCEKCGGEYGKLGHDWGEWTSNGDGTHSRPCKRDGCSAVDTENCGGGNATCVTPGTCTACGGQYSVGHYFGPPWKYGYDENTHWHACYYCENGKDAEAGHYFVQSNMYLKSPATCVSKAVYYVNCATCRYKGTDTYEYQYGNVDPKNHTGVTEVRGAVDADCTHEGYTGDTYCKDCDAKIASGKAIPATGHVGGTEVRGKKDADCTHEGYTGDTYCKDCDARLTTGKAIPAKGHTGGTATCCWPATCEVCGQRYGDYALGNHIVGCEPKWTVTETEHEQKYSYCGRIAVQKGEHTFGDWTVTQEATESKDGEQERVCTTCSYTETETISAKVPAASPAPVPAAMPEPTAAPVEQPTDSGSSWWWIIILVAAAGVGQASLSGGKRKIKNNNRTIQKADDSRESSAFLCSFMLSNLLEAALVRLRLLHLAALLLFAEVPEQDPVIQNEHQRRREHDDVHPHITLIGKGHDAHCRTHHYRQHALAPVRGEESVARDAEERQQRDDDRRHLYHV